MGDLRSTQQVIETLLTTDPSLRVTQQIIEVVYTSGAPGPGNSFEGSDGTDKIHNQRGIVHETGRGAGKGKKYSPHPPSGVGKVGSIAKLNAKMSNRLFPPRYYVGNEDF